MQKIWHKYEEEIVWQNISEKINEGNHRGKFPQRAKNKKK